MYINEGFYHRNYYAKRRVWKAQNLLQALKEISEKTKELSKDAKELLNLPEVSFNTKDTINQIVKEEGWVIELTQITEHGTGDVKEHRWFIESLEDIHHQRFYINHTGDVPEIFITVKNYPDKGQVIFALSLTEWNII
jgi:hypothetical protein